MRIQVPLFIFSSMVVWSIEKMQIVSGRHRRGTCVLPRLIGAAVGFVDQRIGWRMFIGGVEKAQMLSWLHLSEETQWGRRVQRERETKSCCSVDTHIGKLLKTSVSIYVSICMYLLNWDEKGAFSPPFLFLLWIFPVLWSFLHTEMQILAATKQTPWAHFQRT